MRLNIKQLVRDLGGAAAVAQAIGVARTTPYRWIAHDYVSSRSLGAIKAAYPSVSIDAYFGEGENDHAGNDGTGSAGIDAESGDAQSSAGVSDEGVEHHPHIDSRQEAVN